MSPCLTCPLSSSLSKSDLVRTIDLRHVAEKIQNTTAVAPLVVVPRNELDEVLVQADAGLGVEDGRGRVAVQVAGDEVVLGVLEYACEIISGLGSNMVLRMLVCTYPSSGLLQPPSWSP